MTDWNNKLLQEAAAEFAVRQIGRPSNSAEWRVAAQNVAEGLGVRVEDLTQWMAVSGDFQDKRLVELDEASVFAQEMQAPEDFRPDMVELLERVIAFVCPSERKTTWRAVRNCVAVPQFGTDAHEDSGIRIKGFPKLSGTNLVIRDRDGNITAVRLMARKTAYCRNGNHGRAVQFRQLVPAGHADRQIAMRVRIIESFLHPDRENEGEAIAAEFGVTPAAVHYARKAFREKVGGGIAGMLNKDQRNKGRARTA